MVHSSITSANSLPSTRLHRRHGFTLEPASFLEILPSFLLSYNSLMLPHFLILSTIHSTGFSKGISVMPVVKARMAISLVIISIYDLT